MNLRSFDELKEYVSSTLAVYMSFMVFNITQNIMTQYFVTSSSKGVGVSLLSTAQSHAALLKGRSSWR